VRLLQALHAGDAATVTEMFPNQGKADGDIFTTGLRLIHPDGKTPLGGPDARPLGIENVEVMPLPAFREWLTKYGLTSS